MPVLREPLLHFLLLGAVLFGWFALVSPPSPEPETPDRITIDDQDLERLALRFEATRQRPPTDQEAALMVDVMIRQEVLVREARALGMDADDEVVRNRLSQKMEFLLESGARSLVPEDEVLRAYVSDNRERFMQPGWLAFEQVYLGTDPDNSAVADIKTDLANGADPQQLGRPSQLPSYVPPSRATQVNGLFGRGFFSLLDALPSDSWSDAVQSGFGFHIVRITDRTEATLPEFDDIREEALRDWTRDKAQELSETRYNELKARYEIILPDQLTSSASGASE